jgi:riboflavin synthase
MFTGIVEGIGRIGGLRDTDRTRHLSIVADKILDGVEVGNSVAINGACLTATAVFPGGVEVAAVAETLMRTNLGALTSGEQVNVERPMPASGRFEGHIVQGHVDGVATVAAIDPEGDSKRYVFTADPSLTRYIVEKGSIALDGVSLTVTAVTEESFEVVLIPHTMQVTVLSDRLPGSVVNVELDVIAKYVERMMEEQA